MDPVIIAKLLETIAPVVIQGMGQKKEEGLSQAYQDFLNNFSGTMAGNLEGRASKYEDLLGRMSSGAEGQFLNEANTPLAELTQMKTDISNQSAEAQRQNRLQSAAQLAASGVRGGQAAILQNRATGELNRDLQRDTNQLAYDEAAGRQGSRLNYFGQKAITPWTELSSARGAGSRYANAALSGAQGDALSRAYEMVLSNYPSTKKRGIF